MKFKALSKIVPIGVAALTLIAGVGKWVDVRYAHAAEVRSLTGTVLEIRRDQLAAELREWARLATTRLLSDVEQARLDSVQTQIQRIDEKLRKME